ncbi:MAG TPA: cadherin domain-containing protein [Caulobacter sp.]|nr:cadherin domain-containing protein [Caulobacter sp.]
MATPTAPRDALSALVETDTDPLAAPRVVAAAADAVAAAEDGGPVVAAVLGNDTGVVRVAQINGAAVVPGQVVTLASGVQILVNANGTLSVLVGGAYQNLAAGQTATETFTYVAADSGGSPFAPDGVFNAGSIGAATGFVINGAAAGDLSGYSVAGIGDVNNDGIDDVLVGALQADPGGRANAGTSYVIFGRTGGYGSPIDLSALNGTNGFSVRGVAALDYSGTSVRGVGDVNGDGRADFVIGAPWADSAGGANAGAAYVVFGRSGGFGANLDLSSLNGSNGFVVRGGAASDGLGFAVSAAGDLNNDGVADLVVSARDADPSGLSGAGKTYVLFGKTSAFSASIDVGAINGTNGFTLSGAAAGDASGLSIAAAGDLNNDGIADLIVGAGGADPGGRANAGAAYVLFGKTGGFGTNINLSALNGTNGFTIHGIDAGDTAGWSVASAGDLNADGIDDVAIGALYGDPGGRANAGEVYVLYGRTGGFGTSLNLSGLTAATGFTINGAGAGGLAGHRVTSAGDVNADGIDDLLIGALYADPAGGGTDAGESYVLFGRAGGFGASVDLSSLDGVTGFAVGGGALGGFSGQAVSAAGDVNNDGIDDLIIGSPNADPSGRTDAGVSYVLYGAANVSRLTSPVTVTVTITGTNDAPVISSNGGGAVAATTITENSTAVITTVQAVDIDSGATITYGIAGGADAARFTINPATGALAFVSAANFEAPTDAGGNNIYDVIVQASDGTAIDTQAIAVTVTNLGEAPAITSNGGGVSAAISLAENQATAATVTAADPDAGAMLTYSIVGGTDAADFAINPTTGVLSLVSGPDFEAPADSNGDNLYNVIVQVSDGLLTDTQTLNITVTNVAEAPIITSGGGGATAAYSTTENSAAVVTVGAIDPDGTTPAWSIAGGADAVKFKINAVTGLLEFKVAPNFETPTDAGANNVYEVIVRASDGTLSDTQALAITVTNAAEAPVITSHAGAASAARSVGENQTAVLTYLAVDQDAGTTLAWSIVGGADSALFLIDSSTGALRFANPQNFEAPADAGANNVYDVIVQVSDGTNVDTQALAVTLTNVNEAPAITSDGAGAQVTLDRIEGVAPVTTVTAADPDAGSTLTYSIVGGVDAGHFLLNSSTGELRFANPPDFSAPADQGANNSYQVIVQVSDGSRIDTQAITVRILDANAPPTITSNGGGAAAAVSVAENQTAVTTVTASDPDAGATLSYSIAGGADAAFFTINSATGQLAFASARDFEAPADAGGNNVYDVTVQVSDGTNTDTQAIAVTIDDVAEGPVITSDGGGPTAALARNENGVAVTTITATSALAVTYSIIGGLDAGLFTINSATGVLSFVAAPNFEGPADSDGNNLYQVVVQASDGAATDSQTISVTVQNLNETPAITSNGGGAVGGYTIFENTLGPNTVTAADPDAGATLAYSIVGGADAARFTINAATGVLQLVASPDFENPADANADNVYAVIVQASDGTLTDTQTLNLTVINQNEAPAITSNGGGPSASRNIQENTTAVTTVTAADPDAGATLSYSIIGGTDQALFTINSATGALAFVSGRDFETPTDSNGDNIYNVVVRVSDGTNADTQVIDVAVTNRNEAPVITSNGGGASADIFRPENGSTFVTTVTSSDVDAGATATYSISGGADAAQFTINATTGELRFVATPDFEAPTDSNGDNRYIVTVRVSDGQLTDVQSIHVFVTNVGEVAPAPPVITSNGGGPTAAISVSENTAAVTTVTATDADGPATTYSIVGGIDQGLFTINATTGALAFVSGRDFESPTDSGLDNVYDVIVQASDGTNVDTQAIAVTVTDANEAPAITSGGAGPTAAYGVSENMNPADVTILTAFDPDAGTTFTYSIVGGADQGHFIINSATGVLQFASVRDFEAPADAGGDNVYDLVVQVSDGSLTDTQAIAVTVTNVNEAPAITSNGGGPSASINVAENTTAVTTVTSSDPDGPGLTYSIVGGVDQTLFTINATTGALAFVSGRNFEAPTDSGTNNVYNVVVQVSDGTLTDTQAIAVTVTNVNEAPAITSNGAGPTAAVNVAENGASVTAITAVDPDGVAAPLSFSIVGGADQALFTINAATGALAFVGGRNFESPTDVGANGVYDVVVQVSDGTNTDTQAIAVTVTDLNEAPAITSNGGGATGAASVQENEAGVTVVTAFDPEGATITYSIVGGVDAGFFTIDSSTGALTFTTPPSFESADDSNSDSIYEVTVQASDGTLVDTQDLSIEVTDVDEALVIISDGGDATAGVAVAEGETDVTIVVADDPENTTITYSLGGGADAALFSIDSSTGLLSFVSPPDFEAPADADADNVYEVVVVATDGGGNADSQAISVSVSDEPDSLVLADLPPSLTFNEAGPFKLIAPDANFTDPFGTTFNGGQLVIGGLADADSVTIQNQGIGQGQISLFGSTPQEIRYEGVTIGTRAPVVGLVVNFNSNATAEAIEALVRALQFRSNEEDVISAYSLTITITNGNGDSTGPQSVPIDFIANVLLGTADSDTLDGRAGNDDISGFDGGDTLIGGVGDDSLHGGIGADSLFGGENNDTLDGGQDDDTIDGGGGEDSIAGDGGADRIFGGSGSDFIDGGAEIDTAVFAGSVGSYTISFGTNGEVIVNDGFDIDTLVNVEFLEFSDGTIDVGNDPPVITSDGGGETETLFRLENTFSVTTVTATDPQVNDIITYSIVGGADAGFFTINASTGELEFVSPVDYEVPTDADADNVYEVTVAATDQRGGQDTQTLLIEIEDENEVLILPPKGDGEPLDAPAFAPPPIGDIGERPDPGWLF